MSDTFRLEIYEADSVFFVGDVESLTVPVPDGEYGVMAHHENIVIALVPGIAHYIVPGEKLHYASVSNGMMRVENNHVLVLVETAEHPHEIDEDRALANAEAARENMQNKESKRQYRIAEVSLQREMARLKLKRHLRDMGS